jgi:hypothetical protein
MNKDRNKIKLFKINLVLMKVLNKSEKIKKIKIRKISIKMMKKVMVVQ